MCAITCYSTDGDLSAPFRMCWCSSWGANRIPLLGFEKQPTISFIIDSKLASASTSDLQLRIPKVHGMNYEDFKEGLILSIKGNDGFGEV